MNFTMEGEEKVQQILAMYKDAFLNGEDIDISEMDYTRGHFKRGVK